MKPIWIVVISVVATGGLIGGGTYYFMHKQANTDKANLQTQINDLSQKFADSETALAAATATTPAATTTTPAATTTTPPVNPATPTTTVATTTTYTNTKYGYSFTYPKTWQITTFQNSPVVDNVSPSFYGPCNYSAGDHCLTINMDNSLIYDADKKLSDYMPPNSATQKTIASVVKSFAGVDYATYSDVLENPGTDISQVVKYIVFVHNQKVYSITYTEQAKSLVGNQDASNWQNLSTLTDILATFKLL